MVTAGAGSTGPASYKWPVRIVKVKPRSPWIAARRNNNEHEPTAVECATVGLKIHEEQAMPFPLLDLPDVAPGECFECRHGCCDDADIDSKKESGWPAGELRYLLRPCKAPERRRFIQSVRICACDGL